MTATDANRYRLSDSDLLSRVTAIERIPSWRLWWLTTQPTIEQRLMTAVIHLKRDIQSMQQRPQR